MDARKRIDLSFLFFYGIKKQPGRFAKRTIFWSISLFAPMLQLGFEQKINKNNALKVGIRIAIRVAD
ncbi:hypothetical protein [Alkalimonas sp.]|uniref:hypothetical protein n=1 Tax=Alkalimonas sp. TaxID=1872453 RepID=UPI00263A532B|nr:hypothetical protein [Alkalimonas sp.]MCC5825676.1 hypothetical protein [Alkalimonas sp.]